MKNDLILIFNCGSSSIKYQLISPKNKKTIANGLVERIGEKIGNIKHNYNNIPHELKKSFTDHNVAVKTILQMFEMYGPTLENIKGVGHRVVQGGTLYSKPTIITKQFLTNIKLSDLAPLHNPPAITGIVAAQKVFCSVKHVAIFDTAFHTTIPKMCHTYAIPSSLAKKYNIKRYGFHGTSHQYVSKIASKLIGKEHSKTNSIILHIGNGASITAVKHGKSYDTTMGLTPLEGLVMGTRSGDIDPAIIFYLNKKAKLSLSEIDSLLNKKSGMLGLTGSSDLRDVIKKAKKNIECQNALDVYAYKIKKTIGAFIASLGKVDVIAWTAGVGENNSYVRKQAMSNLYDSFGIELDNKLNNKTLGKIGKISAKKSKIPVYVIPTNEELQMAKQVVKVV